MRNISGKISKNKVSYKEMMKNKNLNSFEKKCECHAEEIEECTCGKFEKVKGDED